MCFGNLSSGDSNLWFSVIREIFSSHFSHESAADKEEKQKLEKQQKGGPAWARLFCFPHPYIMRAGMGTRHRR